MNASNKQNLRQILGKFITGVTVVTTLDHNKAPVGFTANSFTSVSLEPPLVLVCLAQSAGLASVFRRTSAFAINILAADQESISHAFARKDEDRFANIEWHKENTGSPVLSNTAAWLDCEMVERIVAGDHVMLVGKILAAEKSADHPLAYYQGRYCEIDLSDETFSQIEKRSSVHSTTGILVDYADQILLIKQADGSYDVPRTAPGTAGDNKESMIDAAMTALGFSIDHKALFSVVEGRHQQRLSIYYRCKVQAKSNLPKNSQAFSLASIPLDKLSRHDLKGVLQRYVAEKRAGQFGVYVGHAHQGQLEQVTDRKI